jgi:transcriptional regulator of acetoin/glycerol metabolism
VALDGLLAEEETGGNLLVRAPVCDEIGDLALAAQGALLRALQESEVLPVGATRPIPVDFRLVVATHRNLDEMTASGAFRSDLLARMNGYTVSLPRLEERLEDLGTIISVLLRRHAGDGADAIRFTLGAARALFAHDWPLNVRELEKWLTVALPLARSGTIDLEQLPAEAVGSVAQPEPPKRLTLDEERQKQDLVQLLQANQGNVTAVARILGKARTQVQRWLKRYGIRPSTFR